MQVGEMVTLYNARWEGTMTVVSVEDETAFGFDTRVTLTGGALGSIFLSVLMSDISDGRLNAESARLWVAG